MTDRLIYRNPGDFWCVYPNPYPFYSYTKPRAGPPRTTRGGGVITMSNPEEPVSKEPVSKEPEEEEEAEEVFTGNLLPLMDWHDASEEEPDTDAELVEAVSDALDNYTDAPVEVYFAEPDDGSLLVLVLVPPSDDDDDQEEEEEEPEE